MHCPQTWLLLLLSLSSYVSAFYPWDLNGNHPQSKSRSKRFFPIHPGGGDGSLKLDLHKVRRQTNANRFSVVKSNAPSGGANALAIDQDGADYSYFSTFKFGSRAQEMYMLIDTGSANTWVFSSDCKSESCSIHNTFGKEDSTTLKTTANKWDFAYGTGQVSGIVGNDKVTFANFTLSMGFGLAQNASDDFNSYPMDGIMGLGLSPKSNALGVPALMDVLTTQGKLQSNVVGVHLHRAADGAKDGEIIFGGIDTGKFSGSLAYTKTSNDQSWEIPVEDVLIGGTPANFTGRSAIIDTGTTFILMPPKDAQAVHNLIPGSAATGESFTLPCSSNAKLEVRISGKRYEIAAKDYVGKPTQTGSSTCSSNIIGHQAFGEKQWILGDVFLKNVYAIFDFDSKQIGFGLPGSGGSTALASSSSTLGTASTISTPTSGVSSSASASTSTAGSASRPSGTSDSNLGSEHVGNGSTRSNGVVGYWKVGFSLSLVIFAGAFVV